MRSERPVVPGVEPRAASCARRPGRPELSAARQLVVVRYCVCNKSQRENSRFGGRARGRGGRAIGEGARGRGTGSAAPAAGRRRAATTSVGLRLPRGKYGPAPQWGLHDTCLTGIRYQTLRQVRTRGPAGRARASWAASWSRGGERPCRKSATSARVRARVRVRVRARVKAGLGPRLG